MKELGRRLLWNRLDPEASSFDNPFLLWYASHHARGQARAIERKDGPGLDVIMEARASSRFSLGIDDDSTPILGVCHFEAEVLGRYKWADAAMLRGVRGGDWIVIRTPDVRTDEPMEELSIPARLWLPVMPSRLDLWKECETKPSCMRLMTTNIKNGVALLDGKTIQELPLHFKGQWEA